ncbi:MAG: hypothetical protein WBQ76_07125 [Candidatus Korobacteraceae bacterium]
MADNEKITDELLDALTDMLVENRALRNALEEVKQYLPAEAHRALLAEVDHLKSDAVLREAVACRFAQFRGQSIDEILPGLLKRFPKIKD